MAFPRRRAPMLPRIEKKSVFKTYTEAAITYALIATGFLTIAVFGWWWFSRGHVPQNFSDTSHAWDYILFAILTYVVWYQLVTEALTWEVALWMRHPVHLEPEAGKRVALLTAFVPGKEPYDVLERTLRHMVAVKYPHDTWLLDEGNDPMAKHLCDQYGALHYSRHGRQEFNTEDGQFKRKTKAGNYNSWFHQHGRAYEFVAQHDVDFVPREDYLDRTLGYFRDPLVAFVGAPQIYGNVQESWIARGAAEQAYGFYGPMQMGFFGLGMQLFVGANHIIRTKAHDDIGGYSGHVVEDHLTGMRIYRNQWKSVFVPEPLLIGEGPATWSAYFSQQMRWAYGLIDILFRHTPRIAGRMRISHALHYVLLQKFYFFGLTQALGIVLLSLYYVFGIQSTSMDLTELLIFYPPFLIMQIIIFLWLQRFYIRPRLESGLHIPAKVLNIAAWPIYFIAFISALIGKRLNYEVTPKGKAQDSATPLGLFAAHLIVGIITAAGLGIGILQGHAAPQLIFWGVLNSLVMLAFFFANFGAHCIAFAKQAWRLYVKQVAA